MKKYDEIEELLNGYLDGELSHRQQTEVKRLISNDPEIAERLRELESCKKLVGSFGNQTPPEEIIEDIKSALERKTLLQDAPLPEEPHKGRRQLFLRKVISYAAMILLGLILAAVVYKITGPAEISNEPEFARRETQQKIEMQAGEDTDTPQAGDKAEQRPAVAADTAAQQPDFLKNFDVKIELATPAPDMVASVINSCTEHFSLDVVGPLNSLNETASLSVGRGELEFLLSQIDSVLPDKSEFRAELNYDGEKIIVDDLSFSRFAEFFNGDNSKEIAAAVKQAEAFSRLSNTMLAREIDSEIGADVALSRIPKPVLTSDIENSPEQETVSPQEKFFLTLRVKELD